MPQIRVSKKFADKFLDGVTLVDTIYIHKERAMKWGDEELDVRAVFRHYRVDAGVNALTRAFGAMREATGDYAWLAKDWRSPELALHEEEFLQLEEHDFLPVIRYYKGVSKWGPFMEITRNVFRHRGPAPKGGATVCHLYRGDYLVATGQTVCLPQDAFCYETGRKYAYKDALDRLMEDGYTVD